MADWFLPLAPPATKRKRLGTSWKIARLVQARGRNSETMTRFRIPRGISSQRSCRISSLDLGRKDKTNLAARAVEVIDPTEKLSQQSLVSCWQKRGVALGLRSEAMARHELVSNNKAGCGNLVSSVFLQEGRVRITPRQSTAEVLVLAHRCPPLPA